MAMLKKSSSFRLPDAPLSVTIKKTSSFRDAPKRKTQSLPRYPPSEAVVIKPRLSNSEKELRVLVMGAEGVGKTAIIVRFLTKRFIGDYAHSENLSTCTTLIDSKPLRLWIQDTVQDTPAEKAIEHIEWADAFVLVFSLTSGSTIQYIETAYTNILKKKMCNKFNRPPMIVVGNKNDLCHLREVTETHVRDLYKKFNSPVVEVSARESHSSVVDAFTLLFDQVIKDKKNNKKNGTSKIAQIRETLRSLADFRGRTHTF